MRETCLYLYLIQMVVLLAVVTYCQTDRIPLWSPWRTKFFIACLALVVGMLWVLCVGSNA